MILVRTLVRGTSQSGAAMPATHAMSAKGAGSTGGRNTLFLEQRWSGRHEVPLPYLLFSRATSRDLGSLAVECAFFAIILSFRLRAGTGTDFALGSFPTLAARCSKVGIGTMAPWAVQVEFRIVLQTGAWLLTLPKPPPFLQPTIRRPYVKLVRSGTRRSTNAIHRHR